MNVGIVGFGSIGTEVAKAVYDAYDGTLYQYIKINADKEEEVFTKKFNDRVDSRWIYDLDKIDFDDPQFWLKNKRNNRIFKKKRPNIIYKIYNIQYYIRKACKIRKFIVNNNLQSLQIENYESIGFKNRPKNQVF